MAWTAPMTAVAGSVFTAAQFNTYIRDNLAETAPAKATTPGSHFATSATNQIVERVPVSAVDTSNVTTTQTTFSDPDTGSPGPAVTANTGAYALIYIHASMSNSGTGSVRAGYDVSGATTIAGADNRGIGQASAAGYVVVASMVHFHTDLTPGNNTFTMKYRVSASTGTYVSKRICVIPF